MLNKEKIMAVMLGHAVGDALGVPVEFLSREELEESPIDDMEGYGTFPVPEGCWSDDTAMSIATLDSLCKGEVNLDDIMNNFGKWYYEGEYTPTGKTFDVGGTCRQAIKNYFERKMDITGCGLSEESSNGNGSLMRIHPAALYADARNDLSLDEKLKIVYDVSAITHAHERSKVACGIYAFILWEILHSEKASLKARVRDALLKATAYYKGNGQRKHFYRLLRRMEGAICNHYQTEQLKVSDVSSGGYVVDTLEAAVFCLLHTSSYKNCVLAAVNLGNDTDTVAAIAGGLAGAYYGAAAIPVKWLKTLKRCDYIVSVCERACAAWNK